MADIKPILTIVEKAVQEGLREVGRQTLKVARELSPTDTGDSDRSGFVALDDLTVQVGFKSLVSRLQHENLDYQHADGTTAKFLEAAAAQVDVEQVVGEAVRRALNG